MICSTCGAEARQLWLPNLCAICFSALDHNEQERLLREAGVTEPDEQTGGRLAEKGAHLNFIGIDPARRNSRYAYNPVDSFFLEIGLDGQSYRLDVGNIGQNCSDGVARRGVHLFHPLGAELGELSLNSLNIANAKEPPFSRHRDHWANEVIQGLLEIAEKAMPETYFATDSRTQAARTWLQSHANSKRIQRSI